MNSWKLPRPRFAQNWSGLLYKSFVGFVWTVILGVIGSLIAAYIWEITHPQPPSPPTVPKNEKPIERGGTANNGEGNNDEIKDNPSGGNTAQDPKKPPSEPPVTSHGVIGDFKGDWVKHYKKDMTWVRFGPLNDDGTGGDYEELNPSTEQSIHTESLYYKMDPGFSKLSIHKLGQTQAFTAGLVTWIDSAHFKLKIGSDEYEFSRR
jgi:hypothetical protein